MEFYQWLGLGLAIAGFLFGFYKWIVTRNDKRRGELKNAHELALNEHHERLNRHAERLQKLDDLIGLTRDEMARNHPRLDQIEKLEASIESKLDGVHQRLSGISREVSEMVGSMKTRHDSEISYLIDQIKNVLKDKQ